MSTRTSGEDRDKYFTQGMVGVEGDRFKKLQTSFADKVLIRRIIRWQVMLSLTSA